LEIAQCNNFYIFPAIGLAVGASGAKHVTDKMMVSAAEALGNFYSDNVDADLERLLPPIDSMRDLATKIAVVVGLQAQQDGVAPAMSEQELRARVKQRFWIPRYLNYMRVSEGASD
jgi:malate dehydrogenase (oxaloacetate-decarboxylating)